MGVAPGGSRRSPFNVTSAFGRGIRRGARCRATPPTTFNITSAFGRGIPRHPDHVPPRSRRPFNVTSAFGRGIPFIGQTLAVGDFALQRHLGAWPRDTAIQAFDSSYTGALQRHLGAWPRDTGPARGLARGHRPPSTSPRRLAEGYGHPVCLRGRFGAPSTSPRRLAEGYPALPVPKPCHYLPSTSPRRLAEGYVCQVEGAAGVILPSTSPRRLAEGYFRPTEDSHWTFNDLQRHLGAWPRDTRRLVADSGHPRHPSTSPRRLAEGYSPNTSGNAPRTRPFNVTSALGRGIRGEIAKELLEQDSLQRHLGAWPRDTGRYRTHQPCEESLQRHLGVWPRDTGPPWTRPVTNTTLQRHLGVWPRDTQSRNMSSSAG